MSAAAPREPLRHRLEHAAFLAARFVLRALPEGVAIRLGASLGFIVGSVLRIRRRVVERNLAVAFPDRPVPWRRRVARKSYAHLGREAVFLARMRPWTREQVGERVRFTGYDGLRDAVSEGGGALVLSAHLGNWELAGASMAALGLPFDVVGKGMANRRFERALFETREKLGMRVIEMTRAPREGLRSLGAGRVVALLSDQNAHRWGVFVPFFGRLAATPRGAALFALRREVPVFFGVAVREPGWKQRYRIVIRRVPYARTGDAEADTVALLSTYHGMLEEAIRADPEQYFWQHRRWRTRPGEEPASAAQVTNPLKP